MTREVFRRFGLLAASTGYVVALAVVWQVLGPGFALIAAFLGPVIAYLLTIEPELPAPAVPERDFRRDTEARARLSRVEPDDEVM